MALADGRELTGLALQRIYLDRVAKHVDREGDDDPRAADIIDKWAMVLDLLERDPMECAHLLDWPAKLRLLEGFRSREGLAWSAPRLHMIDLQYSDVRLEKGLYNRLVARGPWSAWSPNSRCSTRYTTADRYPRVLPRRMPARFGADIAAASWDSGSSISAANRSYGSRHSSRCGAVAPRREAPRLGGFGR